MNQCLCCNIACPATTVFCDSCRTTLLKRQSKHSKFSLKFHIPAESVGQSPALDFSDTSFLHGMTINRQQEDLSGFPTLIFPGNNLGIDLSQLMPDLWPELEAASEEIHVLAHDRWLQQADPLLSRSLPGYIGSVRPEEQNKPISLFIQEQDTVTLALPVLYKYHQLQRNCLRIAFIALLVLIVPFLVADAVLMDVSLQHHSNLYIAVSPVLTVIPATAHPGQIITVHIDHFPAFAHIVLTRDFQEPVRTYINSSFILLDSSGSANVSIFVEHSWGAGRHIIEGEDSISHYTASTSLQIIRADPLISLE
jgi:hypothetical protein